MFVEREIGGGKNLFMDIFCGSCVWLLCVVSLISSFLTIIWQLFPKSQQTHSLKCIHGYSTWLCCLLDMMLMLTTTSNNWEFKSIPRFLFLLYCLTWGSFSVVCMSVFYGFFLFGKLLVNFKSQSYKIFNNQFERNLVFV